MSAQNGNGARPGKLKRAAAIFAVMVAATCVMIFLFSSQNSMESSLTSGRISGAVCKVLFPGLDEMSAAAQSEIRSAVSLRVRKLAHFTEYLLLAQFAFQLLIALPRPRTDIVCAGGALLFAALFAASDEFHQSFVPGRAMMAGDVLIDSLGALLGIFIALRVKSVLGRKKIKDTR